MAEAVTEDETEEAVADDVVEDIAAEEPETAESQRLLTETLSPADEGADVLAR